MINLSEKNVVKVKNNEILFNLSCEIFAAFVIGYYIEKEDIIVDDKPDFYNFSKTAAYEVVQCDLGEDLDMKYIYRIMSQNYCDYDKTLNVLRSKKQENKYNIWKLKDGSIGIGPCILGKLPFYYLKIFKNIFINKLKKLNNHNYSPFSNVSLVVLSISRFKGRKDAEKIVDLYKEINSKYTEKFSNIFLITTHGLYYLNNQNLEFKKILSVEYNEFVSKTKKLINDIKNKDSSH